MLHCSIETVGRGSFGVVFKCVRRDTGEVVADFDEGGANLGAKVRVRQRLGHAKVVTFRRCFVGGG